MGDTVEISGLAIRSKVGPDGRLRLTLEQIGSPPPGPGEVTIRVGASPVNPSDLGPLLGWADPASLRRLEGAAGVTTGEAPPDRLAALAGRFDQPLAVGAEGAGVVVAAGAGAEHLMGRTVASMAGGMYAQLRTLPVSALMVLPEGVSPREAAACFVNPLTALGMVETMRREGHAALIHTAAASNLGQMLIRLCAQDDVPLVNVVRREDQADLLKSLGARWVLNSNDAEFEAQLADAVAETGATLAFDAVGGGTLATRLLSAMERGLARREQGYSPYGSTTHKQVYLYGALDPGVTVLERKMGMAWGIGGWLLPWFLERIGPEAAQRLRERVVAGLSTTFVSHYTHEIGLETVLDPVHLRAFVRKATGEKYLVRPNGL
jgi:NADPH2:quinone reductase